MGRDRACPAGGTAVNEAIEALAPVIASAPLDPDRRAALLGRLFQGTTACLSAFFAAGRHQELLDLLEEAPTSFWHYRAYGVKALMAMGRKAEALRYPEASRSPYQSSHAIDRACEDILLSSGLEGEAYQRYGRRAALASTYLATFQARVRRYPGIPPEAILRELRLE